MAAQQGGGEGRGGLLLLSQKEESTVSKLKRQINDLTQQRKPERDGMGVNWRL